MKIKSKQIFSGKWRVNASLGKSAPVIFLLQQLSCTNHDYFFKGLSFYQAIEVNACIFQRFEVAVHSELSAKEVKNYFEFF